MLGRSSQICFFLKAIQTSGFRLKSRSSKKFVGAPYGVKPVRRAVICPPMTLDEIPLWGYSRSTSCDSWFPMRGTQTYTSTLLIYLPFNVPHQRSIFQSRLLFSNLLFVYFLVKTTVPDCKQPTCEEIYVHSYGYYLTLTFSKELVS